MGPPTEGKQASAGNMTEVVAWSNFGVKKAQTLSENSSTEVSAWGDFEKSTGKAQKTLSEDGGDEIKAWMGFADNSNLQKSLDHAVDGQPSELGRTSIHQIATVTEDEEGEEGESQQRERVATATVTRGRKSVLTTAAIHKSLSVPKVTGIRPPSRQSRQASEDGEGTLDGIPSEFHFETIPDEPALKRRRRRFMWILSEMSGTMPNAARFVERFPPLEFVDSCLRGVGQVFFMNNPISGIFFLVAVFYYSFLCGLAAIIGVVSSTGISYLIGLNHGSIRSGLFGFNGTLVAIGLITFQNPGAENWDNPLVFIPMVLLSALSSLFFVMAGNILVRHFGLATFTLPFHMCTWLWILGSQQYAYFPNRSLWVPEPNKITTSSDMHPLSYETEKLARTIGVNIAQVFFLENDISGYIMVAGVFVCSRISAVMTVYGSAIALVTAVAIGAPQATIYAGLWGFNAVLVSIAIGGMFYVMSIRVAALATVATMVAVLLFGALSSAFHVFGIPTLTFPGAVVALGFCLLAGAVPGAVPVELDRMTVPEDHWRRFRLSESVLSRFSVVRAVARRTALDSGLLERFLVPVLMCWGARGGDVKVLENLISLGADPSCADYDGRTPLHIAAAEGKMAAVSLLLDSGAECDAIDRYGYRPLDDALAAKDQQATVIAALRRNAATVNASRERQACEMCAHAFKGRTETIALCLRAGYGASNADYDGRTALHLAACEGNANTVMTLVAYGADLRATDRYNNTPADDARLHGHGKLASWLERRMKGPDGKGSPSEDDHDRVIINIEDPDAVSVAATDRKDRKRSAAVDPGDFGSIRGNAAMVAELASALLTPDVASTPEAQGLLPVLLCAASSSGDDMLVRQLCEAGIDPSVADYDGQTGLHLAAAAGHGDVIDTLLSLGAHVNAQNRWRQTPLDVAVRCARDAAISLLVSRGSSLGLDHMDVAGELCRAASRNEIRALKRWVAAGARANVADYDGRTALHVAASKGHLEIVKFLVACGADPAAKDRWGRPPLSDAKDGLHLDVISFLAQAQEQWQEAQDMQRKAKMRAIRRTSQQNLNNIGKSKVAPSKSVGVGAGAGVGSGTGTPVGGSPPVGASSASGASSVASSASGSDGSAGPSTALNVQVVRVQNAGDDSASPSRSKKKKVAVGTGKGKKK